MARKHKNNFSTLLNASLTNVATTVTLLDSIPNFAASTSIRLTIYGGGVYEIIEIPQSGAGGAPTYTGCTRGCEGTTAVAWASGSRVECRVTRDSIDDKQDSLDGLAIPNATIVAGDKILFQDDSDSDNLKYGLLSDAASVTNKYTFITSVTANNTSPYLDITGLGDYSYLELVLNDVVTSFATGDSLFMLTSTDGGSTYASASGSYSTAGEGWVQDNGRSVLGSEFNSHTTSVLLTGFTPANSQVSSAANSSVSGIIRAFNPAGTTYRTGTHDLTTISATGKLARFAGSWARLSAADIDAIRLVFYSAANIASGTVYVYGAKKS